MSRYVREWGSLWPGGIESCGGTQCVFWQGFGCKEVGFGYDLPKHGVTDLCPAAGSGLGSLGAAPALGFGSALWGLTHCVFQDSDGDKSDDLVVDVSNEVSWGGFGLPLSLRHGGSLGVMPPYGPSSTSLKEEPVGALPASRGANAFFCLAGPCHPPRQPSPLPSGERPRQSPWAEEGGCTQQPSLGGLLQQHSLLQD